MILFMVLLVPLIGPALVSLHLAFSGNLAGRSFIGWTVPPVSMFLTVEVVGAFVNRSPDLATRFFIGAFGVILRNYPNSRYAGYARDRASNM